MTWKSTERAGATLYRRTLYCDECMVEWVHRYVNREDPIPDCPTCAAKAAQVFRPIPVLGNKSRAIDMVQKMAEEDYGLTNFNDNQRKGDIAYKPDAPMHTAEREALEREMREAGLGPLTPDQQTATQNFWASQAAPTGNPAIDQAVQMGMANTAASAAVARSEGVDPIAMLHDDGKTGKRPIKLNVMGRAKMDTATV